MKYALIGEKLGHSYSKIIHEKYFKYLDYGDTYDLIEIPRGSLSSNIALMKSQGYIGFNVTIPYKIDTMNICDEVYDIAKRIGSVNTVHFADNKMVGTNTDYYGLKLALDNGAVSLNGKSAVVLGTGGASRAVCTLLEDLGARNITLVSRTPSADFGYKCTAYSDIPDGDVVINTTPVGMYPNTENSPISDFKSFETAVDLIYNPEETSFLKLAQNQGLNTVNGLYMLVAQAVYSECIWHGIKADTAIIDKIYTEMRGF